MHHGIININWTAAPLSDEQKHVILQLAVLLLSRDEYPDGVDFTHDLVEGRLTSKGAGRFGAIPGHFFHADLGHVRGVRWTIDFLVPAGSERMILDQSIRIRSSTLRPDGTIFDRPASLDRRLTNVSEINILE